MNLGTESSMAEQTAAQHELATLIVECLNLEAVTPEQIDPDAPLFGGELGLDSIDALEIALAVSKHYGFQLRSDNPDNRQIFTSLARCPRISSSTAPAESAFAGKRPGLLQGTGACLPRAIVAHPARIMTVAA